MIGGSRLAETANPATGGQACRPRHLKKPKPWKKPRQARNQGIQSRQGTEEKGAKQIGKRGRPEAQCASKAPAAVEGAGRCGRGRALPRGEVVSKVWDYIKKHELQNPENRREILADDTLEAVFGKKKVTMFEMNKYLAQHLTSPEAG